MGGHRLGGKSASAGAGSSADRLGQKRGLLFGDQNSTGGRVGADVADQPAPGADAESNPGSSKTGCSRRGDSWRKYSGVGKSGSFAGSQRGGFTDGVARAPGQRRVSEKTFAGGATTPRNVCRGRGSLHQ